MKTNSSRWSNWWRFKMKNEFRCFSRKRRLKLIMKTFCPLRISTSVNVWFSYLTSQVCSLRWYCLPQIWNNWFLIASQLIPLQAIKSNSASRSLRQKCFWTWLVCLPKFSWFYLSSKWSWLLRSWKWINLNKLKTSMNSRWGMKTFITVKLT